MTRVKLVKYQAKIPEDSGGDEFSYHAFSKFVDVRDWEKAVHSKNGITKKLQKLGMIGGKLIGHAGKMAKPKTVNMTLFNGTIDPNDSRMFVLYDHDDKVTFVGADLDRGPDYLGSFLVKRTLDGGIALSAGPSTKFDGVDRFTLSGWGTKYHLWIGVEE